MTDRYDPDRARAEELSADIDLTLHLFDLRMIATARGDLATLRRINDFDAARSYTGPLMEPGEFSALLVREGEEAPTGVDLYNACMGIQDAEGFKGLPQDRRAQAITTAGHVMDQLMARRTAPQT